MSWWWVSSQAPYTVSQNKSDLGPFKSQAQAIQKHHELKAAAEPLLTIGMVKEQKRLRRIF